MRRSPQFGQRPQPGQTAAAESWMTSQPRHRINIWGSVGAGGVGGGNGNGPVQTRTGEEMNTPRPGDTGRGVGVRRFSCGFNYFASAVTPFQSSVRNG